MHSMDNEEFRYYLNTTSFSLRHLIHLRRRNLLKKKINPFKKRSLGTTFALVAFFSKKGKKIITSHQGKPS